MKTISFKDIDVSADGWLRCNVERETVEQLRIQLPHSYIPSPDLIVAALSTLCGDKFDSVHMDLPVGPALHDLLESELGAKFSHRQGVDRRRSSGRRQGLHFSGGFDSLAAKAILPNAELISYDFGGAFRREEKFFREFRPHVFRTNLTSLKLNRNSWQFMGLGSILLRDELDLKSYSFGSIMAGSLPRLFSRPLDQSDGGIRAANLMGMSLRNPVAGLSEIAALTLAAQEFPLLLRRSLMSVASPAEDKYRRKYLMLHAVMKALDMPISVPVVPEKEPSLRWGESFADDLASLYVMKILGPSTVQEAYAGHIPEQVQEFVEKSSLNFMTRINPQAYEGVPNDEGAQWMKTLVSHGLLPFYRADWEEAAAAMKLLRS